MCEIAMFLLGAFVVGSLSKDRNKEDDRRRPAVEFEPELEPEPVVKRPARARSKVRKVN
jgi:hypothetical protein